MNHSHQLADRLEELFLSGTWVAGTNFRQQLDSTNFDIATKNFAGLNTIAALTFHVNYYVAGVLQVLRGGTLDIRDKYSYQLPALKDETDWTELKKKFLVDAEQFIQAVRTFPENRWNDDFVDPKYGTYSRNVEVILEHSYYHLGQLVLIRKLLETV